MDAYLRRKYASAIREVVQVEKEDLDMKNHLSGRKRTLLQVVLQLARLLFWLYLRHGLAAGPALICRVTQVKFWNVDQLMEVKREVLPVVKANAAKRAGTDAYAAFEGRDADARCGVQVKLATADTASMACYRPATATLTHTGSLQRFR